MEGICPVSGIRAFQVDLITGLDWKGLPYLPAETLLSGAVPRRAGNLEFFVPYPAHEAIVSLLTSLLVSGALKEKYLPNVERTFKSERARVEAALIPQFGAKTVAQLVDAVIAGDRPKMLSCVRPMRISLGLRSLMRRPFRSVRAVAAHYWREFAIRCLPSTLETVCISAPEGLSKAEVVDRLIPMLKTSAKFVQKRDLGRTIFPSSRLHHESAKAAGRAQAPLNSIASMRNVCLWLVREWLSKFERRENLTLRIEESHPIDLVIDPESYRYGGPMWFARLGCKFYPLPELWILLENQVRGGDSIDSEPIPKRSVNQLESICTSVKLKSRCVVFDASRPADFLAEEVYRAIIDALDQRTAERLKRYK